MTMKRGVWLMLLLALVALAIVVPWKAMRPAEASSGWPTAVCSDDDCTPHARATTWCVSAYQPVYTVILQTYGQFYKNGWQNAWLYHSVGGSWHSTGYRTKMATDNYACPSNDDNNPQQTFAECDYNAQATNSNYGLGSNDLLIYY